MAQKTLTLPWGTTTRQHTTTPATRAGAGGSTRLYTGRRGTFDYRAYLGAPELSSTNAWWNDVGRIVSAVLRVWVDDGTGIDGNTMPSGTPNVTIRRATGGFGEFSNSAAWAAGDWTHADGDPGTTDTISPPRTAGVQVDIGVSGFVEDWAPARVLRRDGGAGRALANHGFVLFGPAVAGQNWAIYSDDEAVRVDRRPVLILNYELGTTRPNVPTNLVPTGNVATATVFSGDFADSDPSDRLARSQVQVFLANAVRSGVTGANNWVEVSAHGFQVGSQVWFLSLAGGSGLSVTRPHWVTEVSGTTRFRVTDELIGGAMGATISIPTPYTSLTVASPIYDRTGSEAGGARFNHQLTGTPLPRGLSYLWRARVYDNEGDVSMFTALTAFSMLNVPPSAPPLISPPDTQRLETFAQALFAGSFEDPDMAAQGDHLWAFQVQLSRFPEGDARWEDNTAILWNTGQAAANQAGTPNRWETGYFGSALEPGTYYWRARVWDNHGAVSPWSYRQIVLTLDTQTDPANDPVAGGGTLPGTAPVGGGPPDLGIGHAVGPDDYQTIIQRRPSAPWRIVIRDMFQPDGVTRTLGRGPGRVVAILEDAMNVGASIMYNTPGEAHWTLGADHPQISVIEPRQTHYAIEFAQGDGWREVFAGLVWSVDATDKDVVFKGIDYLALLDHVTDTRFDPLNIDRDYLSGGSKYTNRSIRTILIDQLTQARDKANSPVGFIAVNDVNFPTMSDQMTIWATYEPTLSFVTQLIDSHRAGKALNTRLSVRKTRAGYAWVVQDNPGVLRSNLPLRYGEMVQGYRVKPIGDDWYTRVSAVGREQGGVKIRYSSQQGVGIDETVWGRFDYPTFIDGVSDENDLVRRSRQMATEHSRLGRHIGLGIREGMLLPRDGYDLMDRFPIEVVHGAIDTRRYGTDGEWMVVGITWQTLQDGSTTVTLSFLPKEGGSAPSSDLLVNRPISPQPEWQIGWQAPDPLTATGVHWLDQSAGTVYRRAAGVLLSPHASGGSEQADTVNAVGHGMTAGTPFRFINVDPPDAGVRSETIYYVLAEGLTPNSFRFSATLGGPAFRLTVPIVDCDLVNVDLYTAVADGTMDAPGALAAPAPPTLTGATISGVVRLNITLAAYSDPANRVRASEVQVTHRFTGATPEWASAETHILPPSTTQVSVPCLPDTSYAVRARVQDTYGNFSGWSAATTHITMAGSDAVQSLAALLASDVLDGTITTTKIANNAITTPKLAAGSITADKIVVGAITGAAFAAEVVLGSRIMTGASGARVELDDAGIRTYDSLGGLLTNLGTDARQMLTAVERLETGSLVSRGRTELRGQVALVGGTALTLGVGVPDPEVPPVLVPYNRELILEPLPPYPGAGIFDQWSSPWQLFVGGDPTASSQADLAYEYADQGGSRYRLDRTLRKTAANLEGPVGRIVGVCSVGGLVFCLDANGVLFRYNYSDYSYVGQTDLSAHILGTRANAGLGYDGTNLFVTTTTGVTGTDQVRLVFVSATTGQFLSALNCTGLTINGSTGIVRGGYLSGTEYWVAIVSGSVVGVYAFTGAGANIGHREYGTAAQIDAGVCRGVAYDPLISWGTQVRGRVIRHSNWDWTTQSPTYWMRYTWRRWTQTENFESLVGPAASITLGRRRWVACVVPSLPDGYGVSVDPAFVRVYAARGATDPGAANSHGQSGGFSGMTFVVSSFTESNSFPPASNNFPSAAGSEIRSRGSEIRVLSNGRVEFGPGGGAASDTNLYRSAADTLRTDDNLVVGGNLTVLGNAPGGLRGFAPYAYPLGGRGQGANVMLLAANGGSVACPVVLDAPLRLQEVAIWNTDTTGARSWGWDLYEQQSDAQSVLARVATGEANQSFTAAAASRRVIAAAGAPVVLNPGIYWLVIQNRHSTATFGVGFDNLASPNLHNRSQTRTTTNPNGATLDMVTGWTKSMSQVPAAVLVGRVFGQATGF